MTKELLREKYPDMPAAELERLYEIEKKLGETPSITIPDNVGMAGLCRIDEPDCESCQ